MGDYLDSNRGWMPPLIDDEAPGQYRPQNLSGTGTAEASNSRPFSKDRMHLLSVGSVPVRIGFSAFRGLTDAIPADGGMILPANEVVPFRAFVDDTGKYGALFVYVEAADGVSDYEVSVIQRER